MDEICSWIAERYEFDVKLMQESARGWWRFAFTLMPISAGCLVFLVALWSHDDVQILGGLRSQIPGWLGPTAYITFWIGLVAALYSWAIRTTAKRLRVLS